MGATPEILGAPEVLEGTVRRPREKARAPAVEQAVP
jgi:hypothetical protein